MFKIGETDLPAFELPLRSSPDASSQWSRWLPEPGNAQFDKELPATGSGSQMSRSEPTRSDRSRWRRRRHASTSATATSSPPDRRLPSVPTLHQSRLGRATSVAVLPGEPALLVTAENDGVCRVVEFQRWSAARRSAGVVRSTAAAQPSPAIRPVLTWHGHRATAQWLARYRHVRPAGALSDQPVDRGYANAAREGVCLPTQVSALRLGAATAALRG